MTPDPEHDQLQEEVGFGGSSFAEAPPTQATTDGSSINKHLLEVLMS